jgi:hypothetical protein
MNRPMKEKLRVPPWMALALMATMAGCSAASQEPTTGLGQQNPPTQNSTNNTGTQQQGTAGDTSGSASSGSTGGSSGGTTVATSGSGAGSASGGAASSSGSASSGLPSVQATDAGVVVMGTAATDLAAPDPADGIQFVTPPGLYAVAPNQEIFPNYCVVVPKDIQVGGFQSFMTANSSHHFILYQGSASSSATTGANCSLGAATWVYATSTPGEVVGLPMPANVGLEMAANTQLIINEHFINPGTETAYPQIKLNLLFATNVKYEAGVMVSFNVKIDVPAATAAGPGQQTVNGTCTAPAGSNFFAISTHTHKHATAAWVDYTHDGTTTEIVHTGALAAGQSYPADQEVGSGTDWEHPGVGLWETAPFLTTSAGDTFQYNCSYTNTGSTAVTVGETAAYNEMCMSIGYYFPKGTATCD